MPKPSAYQHINLHQEEKLTTLTEVPIPPREPLKILPPVTHPGECDRIDLGVVWTVDILRGHQMILCADKCGKHQFRRQQNRTN